jgi:hypothetical protein
MNKKDYLEKTKKLAKVTRILCRIAVIASAVGLVILAATVIAAYAVPPDHIKLLTASGKLNIILTGNLYIPTDAFTSVEALRAYLFSLLARVTVSIAIFIVAVLHLVGLLKSVENDTPFEAGNVTRLRKIAIVLIIGSVIIPAVTGASVMLATRTNLLDIKANSMIDTTLLLCGALVFILSGIFAYGARLQREHDETV